MTRFAAWARSVGLTFTTTMKTNARSRVHAVDVRPRIPAAFIATSMALFAAAFAPRLAHAAPAAALQVKDDRGVTVELQAPPRRIVSLLPSLTETVCELGDCDKLVGVDRYSNYPARTQALPKLGGLDDTAIELLVSLKPDVVLLGVSARVIDRLESLGSRSSPWSRAA